MRPPEKRLKCLSNERRTCAVCCVGKAAQSLCTREPETDNLPEKRCADKYVAAFLRRAEIRFILPSPASSPRTRIKVRISYAPCRVYHRGMKLRCLFLRNRPMLSSIIVRSDRFTALWDDCGIPIERDGSRRWVNATPLISGRDEAA